MNGPTARRLDRDLYLTFGGREVRLTYPTEIQAQTARQFLSDKFGEFEKQSEVRVYGEEQSRIRFINRFLDIVSGYWPHITAVDSLSARSAAHEQVPSVL